MGFFMDGLDAEEFDRKYSDGQLVRRILGYMRPHARRMAIVIGAIALTSLLEAGLPIFISYSIDRLGGGMPAAQVVTIGIALTLLACTSWLLNALRQTIASRAVGDIVLQMRSDAADAVLDRDMSFYDQFASGKIVSRVTSDTQAFAQVMTLTMEMCSRLLLVVVLLTYLFSVSARLAIILLILMPFIMIAALTFRAIARSSITSSRRMNATVSSHIQETVSGIGVAKTFRQEPAIHAEFLEVNTQSRRVNLRTRYVFSSIFPVLNVMAGIGTASLVYFGGIAVRDGSLTPGSWFLFIQGLALFWFPLTSIASFWSQFQLGLAAGERVFALIDAEPRVVQTDNIKPAALRGDIRFVGMDFSYDSAAVVDEGRRTKDESDSRASDLPSSSVFRPSSSWVLSDFDLHIRPGETVALVGHTGSGKSSIGKLIARFYEFQGGQLLIDDQDIRSFDLGGYRSQLGIVTQTPFLFDGTVRENIRYGRPEADDAEVERAAHTVGGGDWIVGLPDGLDTDVGERGANLSMGQRQLVALARVLLQDPAIIILDEATASIDPLTEAMIQEGLDVALQQRTSIVIAHRLSTVRHADRIIVLRKGEIIEEGNHDSLLRRGGHYAELYNTYFRHQSLEYIEESGNDTGGMQMAPALA